MGKGALILALAAVIYLSFSAMTRQESSIELGLQDADYADEVVSRQVAESSFNIVVSLVKADFENYRGSVSGNSYRGADIAYSAADGTATNEVIVTASGTIANHEFEIVGQITLSDVRLLDALSIDGLLNPGKTIFSPDAVIRGYDTNSDGSDGALPEVYAVLTTSDSTMKAMVASTSSSQIMGRLDEKSQFSDGKSIVADSPVIDLNMLATAIETYAGADLLVYNEDVKWSGTTVIGSADAPKVVRITGDLEMKGDATGFGILYVHGNMLFKEDARWNGVVYQFNDGGKFEMRGSAAIYGAAIARSIVDETADAGGIPDLGLPGGHFDVDVFDEVTTDQVYHEHRYDDKYDVTGTDVLIAGCKSKGLCWDQIMGAYTGDEVEITFHNASYSKGSYLITADGVNYAGSTTENLVLRTDHAKITTFKTNFTELCAFVMSEPKSVQGDPVNRNNAFTIRVHAIDGGGAVGEMLYELSVYHHWKESDGHPNICLDNDTDIVDGDGGGGVPEYYGSAMSLKIDDSSQIKYSATVLQKMHGLIDEIKLDKQEFIVLRLDETARRTGTARDLRHPELRLTSLQ